MVNKSIADWQKEIHRLAVSKGWWETERSPLEMHMLIVSEIAEATEAVRKKLPPFFQYAMYSEQGPEGSCVFPIDDTWDQDEKPEGELAEIADVVIRVMDYCGSKGWDLEEAIKLKHEYNKGRPHRHGGKRF